MNRVVLFFLLFVMLTIIMNSSNVYSTGPMPIEVIIGENDPCNEWFPDIDYNCHGSFILEIEECDCDFIVEYCSRDLPNGGEDYQITGIYGQAHLGNNDCETCATRAEIYQEAYLYLLVNNPDGFYIEDQLMLIQQAPCIETVREDDDPMDNIHIELNPDNLLNPELLSILVYSITYEGNYKIDIDFVYQPCGNTCCHMQYFIELNPLTMEVDAIYHNMEGVHPWPDCDNPACIKNCDILEFDWTKDDGFQRVCIEISNKTAINKSVSVIPNPNDGNFIIKVQCIEKGNTIINLFNIRGECIYTISNVKTSDIFIKNIQTNLDDNTIINYNVIINNKLIDNGMFIINK